MASTNSSTVIFGGALSGSGSLSGSENSGVSTTPGYTTIAFTPVSHRSTAIASENTDSAAFDAS